MSHKMLQVLFVAGKGCRDQVLGRGYQFLPVNVT